MAISNEAFRQVLSQWASGVTVVTSRGSNGPEGLTVSSFASVSLDPPLVLACIHRESETLAALDHSHAFAVNLLGAEQAETGKRFAGLIDGAADRFAGVATTSAVTGSPLLAAALAVLDCRVWRTYDGGDHLIVVGEVVHAAARAGAPLLYHARGWREIGAPTG